MIASAFARTARATRTRHLEDADGGLALAVLGADAGADAVQHVVALVCIYYTYIICIIYI